MKRFAHRRSITATLAMALMCAVACVAAVDPFIDDQQPATPPQQAAPIRAAPTPPPTQPVPPVPKPEPPKPLQSPPPAPAAPKPTPPQVAATPVPVAPAQGTPKPGEPAIPHAKGAATETAVPVPVATAPAKPVVSSSAVNITAVPTAAPAPVRRGEAVAAAKKPGAAALFDVKVKGTHVAISPSGDVMVRNPDLDINTMRVVQMIAGIVQAIKRVAEAAKPAHHKEPADVEARKARAEKAAEEKEDEDEDESKGDAAAANPPAPVVVKQKVTVVTGGGDADGAEAVVGRMQPLPAELIGDESTISSRPFIRHNGLVDDAKPYARKLHYRVRRSYTPGASSVGDIRFDGFAPITMQLQQVSTIPSSEFAPDSYRFAVDVPGQTTFYLDLPRRA